MSRLYHQIHGVPVFDVILLEKLSVCECFAFEEEALGVSGGCGWLCRELGFYSRNRVCWVYAEREASRRLQGLERKRDRGCEGIGRSARDPSFNPNTGENS